MKASKNIFIIGPWGVGKSTIGREIARALTMQFYDTDRELENRMGVNISWIFDVEGEEGFRLRETAILQELVQLKGIVLSTGAGTIVEPENRALLSNNGLVIYLQTSLNQQLKRTQYNKHNRPMLRVDNVKERLEYFDQQRRPLYEEIADLTFATSGRSANYVVSKILAKLQANGFEL
jgi:shikimate kinase